MPFPSEHGSVFKTLFHTIFLFILQSNIKKHVLFNNALVVNMRISIGILYSHNNDTVGIVYFVGVVVKF